MAFEATKAQQNAIDAKGTILVSAAAGSGKTAVLVERVIKLITSEVNPIAADRLLIVTFTKAAAAEMRTRIEKRMTEECEKHPKGKFLVRQRLLLQNASICTIDAFCIDLVKSNFADIGIEPDFKIVEPQNADYIKLQLAEDMVISKYSGADGVFLDLAASLGGENGNATFISAILKIYENSRSMPFPELWLDSIIKMYEKPLDVCDNIWVDIIFNYTKETLQSLQSLLEAALSEIYCDESAREKCLDIFETARNELAAAFEMAENKNWDNLYEFVYDYQMPPLGRILSKIENIKLKEMLVSLREQVNSRIKTLSKAYKYEWQVTAQMQDKCKDSVIRLVELVKEFAELFDSEMRQRKSLTFDMVEHLALKLLCTVDENGNISQSERAGEINGCYHEVLVDEYQDTNNLQDALFYALSDDGKKLFMVGDVKQSIYGFRHANPENFLKRKDEYANFDGASNPSKIVLDANFRSRKGICDYINFFFQRVMSKKTGSLDYGGEEMLTFSAQYKERSESDVELHFLELLDEDDTRAEAEGKHIAAFIAKTMKSKAFLRDKKGGNEFRKAEFSDFAILLRSVSKNAAIYVEALKSRGIPVAFDSGDYFRTPEILTLMSILKTINNPSDDVALIAAMTSYAFGFSYSEIAEIRLKNRNERFIGSVVLAANKEDEKCKEFLEKIKKYRRLASSLTVSKLIDEILNTTMLAEIFSALDKGEQRRANLLNLKAYAEQFQKNSASNLFLFIRYIDGMADSGKSIGKNASGGNGVRIMSIHASKGLQFPICIIASNSAKINTSDSIATLLVSEKYGVGMMCNNRASGERFSSLPRQAIAIEAVNRNISEELRLLYVAMTRAEEKLVMILSEDNLAKSICTKAMSLSDGERLNPFDVLSARRYTDWIISTTLMHDEGIKLCEYAGIGHVPPKDSAAQIEVSIGQFENEAEVATESVGDAEPDDKLLQKLSERFSFRYPFESSLSIPAKLTVTEIIEEQDDDSFAFSRRPECMSVSGLTPAERGTAAHKFMQYADLKRAKLSVKEEIARLLEFEYLTEREAAAIDPVAIEMFLQSELCERIEKSEFVKKEQRFLCTIDAPEKYNSNEKVIIQGCVDCLFAENGMLTVVDFKTSKLKTEEEHRIKYKKQLDIYADVMSKTYNMPIGNKIIYSLYLNKSFSL